VTAPSRLTEFAVPNALTMSERSVEDGDAGVREAFECIGQALGAQNAAPGASGATPQPEPCADFGIR